MTIDRRVTPHPRSSAGLPAEDVVLQTARGLALELGSTPVAAETGAILRLLATVSGARAVVEIGTGTGVSGLWLLRGMRADGLLTTIDSEADRQRMARRLFFEAGFTASRTRIITGHARSVLSRLAEGSYDLVFLDQEPDETELCAEAAAKLLHTGGQLIVHGVRTLEATARITAALPETPMWVPVLIPVGDGLLVALRQ